MAPTSSETELSSPIRPVPIVVPWNACCELRRDRTDGRGVGAVERQHQAEDADHTRARGAADAAHDLATHLPAGPARAADDPARDRCADRPLSHGSRALSRSQYGRERRCATRVRSAGAGYSAARAAVGAATKGARQRARTLVRSARSATLRRLAATAAGPAAARCSAADPAASAHLIASAIQKGTKPSEIAVPMLRCRSTASQATPITYMTTSPMIIAGMAEITLRSARRSAR